MTSIEVAIVENEVVGEQPFIESADIPGMYLLTDGDYAQIAIPSPGSDKLLLIKFKRPV